MKRRAKIRNRAQAAGIRGVLRFKLVGLDEFFGPTVLLYDKHPRTQSGDNPAVNGTDSNLAETSGANVYALTNSDLHGS